mmetsp:Transcript_14965/g.41398  ORF Transcript_14965/g.41398 Transcript_14965/m.41398 type:complete len:200 (+) Transcript_14965:28-627(+)
MLSWDSGRFIPWQLRTAEHEPNALFIANPNMQKLWHCDKYLAAQRALQEDAGDDQRLERATHGRGAHAADAAPAPQPHGVSQLLGRDAGVRVPRDENVRRLRRGQRWQQARVQPHQAGGRLMWPPRRNVQLLSREADPFACVAVLKVPTRHDQRLHCPVLCLRPHRVDWARLFLADSASNGTCQATHVDPASRHKRPCR